MTMEPRKILLVEDDPRHAELTIRMVRKHHALNTIRVAHDGAQALEMLATNDGGQQWRPKFVLLDLKLPKIDGIDVLRRIKRDPWTRVIPIVMLSSSRDDPDLEKCYELGAGNHIIKPVDLQRFTEVVQQLGFHEDVLEGQQPSGIGHPAASIEGLRPCR